MFDDRSDALSHFFQRAGEAPRLLAVDDTAGCPMEHALAVLEWAAKRGISQIVALDNMSVRGDDPEDGARPAILGVGSTEDARKRLRNAGVEELDLAASNRPADQRSWRTGAVRVTVTR